MREPADPPHATRQQVEDRKLPDVQSNYRVKQGTVHCRHAAATCHIAPTILNRGKINKELKPREKSQVVMDRLAGPTALLHTALRLCRVQTKAELNSRERLRN